MGTAEGLAGHGGEADAHLHLPGGAGGGAQARVDELVDAEVDEGERGAQQGDAESGRDEPPPGALGEGLVGLGQKRTVPQFQCEMSATPMKARVISVRTAKMTVPTKPEAITAVRFGMISKRMIRQVDSPVARAAST